MTDSDCRAAADRSVRDSPQRSLLMKLDGRESVRFCVVRNQLY